MTKTQCMHSTQPHLANICFNVHLHAAIGAQAAFCLNLLLLSASEFEVPKNVDESLKTNELLLQSKGIPEYLIQKLLA